MRTKMQVTRTDGTYVSKSDPIFELLGDIDELSANLSLLVCKGIDGQDGHSVRTIIEDLVVLSAELSVKALLTPAASIGVPLRERLAVLRTSCEELRMYTPSTFVCFFDNTVAAQANLSRAVCRRAERGAVRLAEFCDSVVEQEHHAYLDLVSTWLFLFACKCKK